MGTRVNLIAAQSTDFKVFVSSTIGEHADLRPRVRDAISAEGWTPILFEEAGARPYPPRRWYEQHVLLSEVFVAIYTREYGWIAPNRTISGIEDELQLAADKQRFVYLVDCDDRDPRLLEMIARIEREGDIMYARVSTADELPERIVRDLKQALLEGFRAGVVRQTSERNRATTGELAPPETEPVARPEVVSALMAVVDRASAVVLVGSPGLGKTTSLYLLAATSGRPSAYARARNRSVKAVAIEIARGVGVDDDTLVHRGVDLAALGLLIEERLKVEPVLLLIDDLDSSPRLARFLSGIEPGLGAIVATARSLPPALGWLTPVSLIPMTSSEMDQFLETRDVGVSDEQRVLVKERAAGNPLYLEHFVRSPDQANLPSSLAEYQRVLWDSLPADLRLVVGIVAASLVPPSAATLRLVTERLGLRFPNVLALRDRIADAQVFTWSPDGSIELFHASFDEYALERLERDGARTEVDTALGEEAETGDLLTAAYHFARAGDDRALDHIDAGLVQALSEGRLAVARQLLEALLLHRQGLPSGWLYQNLAAVAIEEAEYESALVAIEEGLASLTDEDEASLRSALEDLIPLVRGHMGNPQAPIAELRVRLDEEPDGHRRARIGVNLSYLLLQAGHHQQAADLAAEAFGFFEQAGDEHGVQTARLNLSAALGELGDSAAQEQHALALLERGRETGQRRIVAGALNHLMVVRRRCGDLDGAASAGQEAVDLAREMALPDVICTNLVSLGNVERDRGDPSRALSLYEEALRVSREHDLVRQEGHALELMAKLSKESGTPRDEVIAVLDVAIEREREGGSLFRLGNAIDLKASLFVDDDPAQGAQLYSEAASIYVEAGAREDAAESLDASVRLAMDIPDRDLVTDYARQLCGLLVSPTPVAFADSVGSLAKAGEWEAARLLVHLIIKRFGSDSDYERTPEVAVRLAQLARANLDPNSFASWAVLVAAAALLDQMLPPPNWDQTWRALEGHASGLGWRQADEWMTWNVELGVGGAFVIQIDADRDDDNACRIAAFLALTAWLLGPRLQDIVALGSDEQRGQTYVVFSEDVFLGSLDPGTPNPLNNESSVAIFRKADLYDDCDLPIIIRDGASDIPSAILDEDFGPLLRVIGEWATELVFLGLRREPTEQETKLLVSICASALRMKRIDE